MKATMRTRSRNRPRPSCSSFARLAAPDPVVFCCDQAESLQTYAEDRKGLFAYAKLAASLLEELPNAVLISSVQSVFVQTLRESLHESFFDRLSLHRAELKPLSWIQGQALLISRLDAVPELAALRRGLPGDPLWPLHEWDLKPIFEPGDSCVARKLLFRAKELFEAERGQLVEAPASEPETLEAALESYWAAAREAAARTPAEDTLLQGLPILFDLTNRRPRESTLPRYIDLLVDGPRGATAVSVANQPSMNSLAARLRKLSSEWDSERVPRLTIVRAAPITRTAVKTRQRLQQLQERGASFLQPSAEVLAAIEAVRRLMADAKAGNLVHRGETIRPENVREWLRSNIPTVVDRFLAELAGEASQPPGLAKDLAACLAEQCIVSVNEVAQAIGSGAEEIIQYARAHPDEVGLLSGPPQVLFRIVDAPIGDQVG